MALVNSIAPCHLEFLGSLEGIAREKSRIFSGLPADGTAVIPQESPGNGILRSAASKAGRILTFGYSEKSTVQVVYKGGNINGSSFELINHENGERALVNWSLSGRHQACNAAGAAAVAVAFGIPLAQIAGGIRQTRLPGMRMRLAEHGGATWLNDAYNANPDSMRASLEWLSEFADEDRLLLVLGDMGEIGKSALKEHLKVLYYARQKFPEARIAAVGAHMSKAVAVMNLVSRKNILPFPVTEEAVARYLRCRERKLRLIDEALRLTEGRENIHFLIGVDDSAPTDSVQTNELAYLRQAVAGRGAVLSGADEDGMLALCRMFAVSDYQGALPTVTVRYFGGSESGASSDYDHQPMTEIVAEHLAYLGCGAGEDGDLQLLVLTAPAEESQRKTAIRQLIAALRQARKDGTPTILMDAAKNGYGTDFQRELVKKTELGFLLGYAGFYDLANATGIALANGVARWLCLQSGAVRTQGQEDAFRRTLADSLVKDICYKNQAKIQTTVYVRDTLQGDPDNFRRTGTAEEDVLPQAEAYLREAAGDVLRNLARSAMRTDAAGTLGGFGSLTIGKVSFPWLRVFEIRMEWEVSR